MATPPAAYVALDAVSALTTLIVAGLIFRIWTRLREPIHLLLALGFLLVGLSFFSVGASQFNLADTVAPWDGLRLAGQLGGAAVIFFAYVGRGARLRYPIMIPLGWTTAAATVFIAAAVWIMQASSRGAHYDRLFAPAHALMMAFYAGVTALSARRLLRRPALENALVPIAFGSWFLTKYTWLIVDLSGSDAPIPFVYAWRLAAIACLMAAVLLPVEPTRGPPHAA